MAHEKHNRNREEELRIAQMISEGGLGVHAYYYNDDAVKEEPLNATRLAAKDMESEGGLGAQYYYNDDVTENISDS